MNCYNIAVLVFIQGEYDIQCRTHLARPSPIKDRCYITEGASQGHGGPDQGYAWLTDNHDPKHPIGFSIMHCHTQDAIGQAGIKISLPPPGAPKHLDVQVKSECEGSKTESGTFYVYSEINASV